MNDDADEAAGRNDRRTAPLRRTRDEAVEIASANLGLIQWTVSRFGLMNHPVVIAGLYDRDDAFSDGWIGLVHGAERWDSDRSTLSTYVTWHIRRAIQLEQDRAAGSGYRRTVAAGELWVRPLSLDAAGGLPAEQAEDTAPRPVLAAMMAAPDDTEAEALDAALLDGALAAGAAACRDDLDRAVLRVLVGELRRTDVAEQFGVSKQTVTNRVAHLVERMRASLRVYASAA